MSHHAPPGLTRSGSRNGLRHGRPHSIDRRARVVAFPHHLPCVPDTLERLHHPAQRDPGYSTGLRRRSTAPIIIAQTLCHQRVGGRCAWLMPGREASLAARTACLASRSCSLSASRRCIRSSATTYSASPGPIDLPTPCWRSSIPLTSAERIDARTVHHEHRMRGTAWRDPRVRRLFPALALFGVG